MARIIISTDDGHVIEEIKSGEDFDMDDALSDYRFANTDLFVQIQDALERVKKAEALDTQGRADPGLS